jgi:homocysteine S-methyltransferase
MATTFPDALASARDGARSLLLDAAMGTELEARGADVARPLWSARALLDAPELVLHVHADDAGAGAEVLTACTFRTHARNVAAAGAVFPRELARQLTEGAVALARSAADAASARDGRTRFVAGSQAPLEDCYSPELVPDEGALLREHGEHAANLAAAGCDLILVETMNTVREAVAAAKAAAGAGLPCVVSAVTDGRGRLLSGETLEELARSLLALPRPPEALGVNCVPARRILDELARLAAAAPHVPLAAYGNTGRPAGEIGAFTEPISPDDYAALLPAWIAAGAALAGGCCGTTPAHTRALRRCLDARYPSKMG